MRFLIKCLSNESFLKILLIGSIATLILAITILSSVPPVSRDALTHHLAVPKLYLEHGGMYEIPTLKFSYYPPNLDLLYLIPLYFGNDIVPKFIHFTFALLTAWLVFNYLKYRINTAYGLIGSLFFLSLPVVVKLSITVYVDLGLIFFSTWALISLLKWIETNFKVHYLIISAISCGLALGTKYNGLITFLILVLFVPYFYGKYSKGRLLEGSLESTGDKPNQKGPFLNACLLGIVFVFIALIVFSPWMIRNYMWTENPVYPLYNSWFNPAPSESATGGSLSHFEIRRLLFGESLWQTLLIPFRIFFEGQDDLPQYFDGKLNPFLFFLPFFAFFRFNKINPIIDTEKKILLAFAILYLLFVFFKTDMRIRYISPIIPPLVILSVYGLYHINTWVAGCFSAPARRIASVAILTTIALMFGLNGAYVRDQFHHVDPFSYLSGRIDRDTYIQRYRPEYKTIQYVNQTLSDHTKILCIYLGNRRYYSEREMIFGDAFFRNSVMRAESTEDIFTDLRERNITHLLVRYDMLNLWMSQQLDKNSKMILERFFRKHTRRIFSKAGYGLFQL